MLELNQSKFRSFNQLEEILGEVFAMANITARNDVDERRKFIESNLPVSNLMMSGTSFMDRFGKGRSGVGSFSATSVSISDVSLSDCTLMFSLTTRTSAGVDASDVVTEKYSLSMSDIGLPVTVVLTSSEGHDHFHLSATLTNPTTVQRSSKNPFSGEPTEDTSLKSELSIAVKDQNVGEQLAEALGMVVTACKAT